MHVMLIDEQVATTIGEVQEIISREEEVDMVVTDKNDVAINPDTNRKFMSFLLIDQLH